MLRKKEDLKEWQKEALQEPKDEIVGVKAPKVLPVEDAPDVPEEFIPEVAPVEEKKVEKKPVVRKTTAKKKTTTKK